VIFGIGGAYIEGVLCPELILFMVFMAKIMAVLNDGGKLLYVCALRRERPRLCKSLIDMMLKRSYILMAGIELYRNT